MLTDTDRWVLYMNQKQPESERRVLSHLDLSRRGRERMSLRCPSTNPYRRFAGPLEDFTTGIDKRVRIKELRLETSLVISECTTIVHINLAHR